MKTIKYDDWIQEVKKQFGKDKKKWKFKCANCGNIQSYHDFKEKSSINEGDIQDVVYFSCIGRWLPNCEGNITNKKSPCNYTNGGLFNFAKIRLVKGKRKISIFEFASQGLGEKRE